MKLPWVSRKKYDEVVDSHNVAVRLGKAAESERDHAQLKYSTLKRRIGMLLEVLPACGDEMIQVTLMVSTRELARERYPTQIIELTARKLVDYITDELMKRRTEGKI